MREKERIEVGKYVTEKQKGRKERVQNETVKEIMEGGGKNNCEERIIEENKSIQMRILKVRMEQG